jgi:hypothetical protein
VPYNGDRVEVRCPVCKTGTVTVGVDISVIGSFPWEAPMVGLDIVENCCELSDDEYDAVMTAAEVLLKE